MPTTRAGMRRAMNAYGEELLTALVERFPNVYQMALLTDDVPRSRGFYEANGFAEVSSLGCLAYVRMN